MGKIAAEAGVNHSLLFHHFKNKQGLWIAAKVSFYEETNARSPVLPSLELPLADFLHDLISNMINVYHANPDLVRMINWQRCHSADDVKLGLGVSSVSQAWMDAFRHYQQKNEINPEYKAEFVLSFVVALISSTALDQNVFIEKEKDLQNYIDFLVMTITKAIM